MSLDILSPNSPWRQAWVQKTSVNGKDWSKSKGKKWFNKSEPYKSPFRIKSVLVHRAGLHGVKDGNGYYNYVCASWTAVCTAPENVAEARCRSARLVLGSAMTIDGLQWIPAASMVKHSKEVLRILLPQFA